MPQTESASLAAEQGTLTTTTIKVLTTGAELIVVDYKLLPSTNPGDNGNWIGLWQNEAEIQWNVDAKPSQEVTGDNQKGTVRFKVDLAQNNYMLGYAVGPVLASPSQKNGNICATIYIPKLNSLKALKDGAVVKAEPDVTFLTSLTLGHQSGDGVTVKYAVPRGNDPGANKSWIGIFRGSAGYNIPPERAVPVKSSEDAAWLGIDHKFVLGKKYTLAWYMSGYADKSPVQKRLAATLEFIAE